MEKLNFLTVVIICLLLSLGQLQRIEVSPGLSFYLHDLLIGLWVGANLVIYRLAFFKLLKSCWLKHSRSITLLGLLLTVGWLRALLNGQELLTPFLYTARLSMYIVFGLLVWMQKLKIRNSNFEAKIVRLTLLLTGLLILFFGLIQYLFLPDTRFLALFGWDDHYFRLISTWFDPAFSGLVLVITWCLLMTVRLPVHLAKAKLEPFLFIVGNLLIAALLLTYSRSSYLAFLISWSYLFLAKSKLRPSLMLMAIIAASGFLFLPKPTGEGGIITRTSTVVARQNSTEETLADIKPLDLLIGQGLFVSNQPATYQVPFAVTNHARVPDNSLIFLTKSLGLIGAGLIIFWLGKWWWWSHRVDASLAASLLALFIHSQFNASLVQPLIFLFLVMTMASVERPAKT